MSGTLDAPMKFVGAYDDILVMLASIEAVDRSDVPTSDGLASGLSVERRVHALSNLSRVLVNLLENEAGIEKAEVYAAVRRSLINGIASGEDPHQA